MDGCFGVGLTGSSGGLEMMWKNKVTLKLLSFSKNHIDMEVNEGQGFVIWRLTGFYGEPVTKRREESWTLLKTLAGQHSILWLCLGEFNEIL